MDTLYIYNPVMFHFAGTVLNNTRLEQLYYIIFIKHYTLLVEKCSV